MSAITIRGLRRQIVIDAAWRESPLGVLETSPRFVWDEPSPAPERLHVETFGLHHRLQLPSGEWLEGSLRDLTVNIDLRLLRHELANAGSAVLPAVVLRDPAQRRVLFVGDPRTGKTWLALALIAVGWRYETDGWVLVRPDGLVGLPRTLRLARIPPGLPDWMIDRIETAGRIETDPAAPQRVIDPRHLAPPGADNDWCLGRARPTALMLLELNPGGRNGARRLAADDGFARVLGLCLGQMSARSAALLRLHLTNVPLVRLRMGRHAGLVPLIDSVVEALEPVLPAIDQADCDLMLRSI
jgi:hypothetical protein